MKDRYSIGVGLLLLAIVGVATLNTLSGDGGEGILGLDRRPDRWPLPEFAVPEAAGPVEADANVAQDDCEAATLPCPEDAVRDPACQIDPEGAIRICDLFNRPLVISFWFARGGDCELQQDVVDTVYRRYRGTVNFLSLDERDDREAVRDLIRDRGWEMPVGYDRDGAVASLYGIGGCPTFAYAYPGGTLQSASSGELSVEQLTSRVEGLLRATQRAEAG